MWFINEQHQKINSYKSKKRLRRQRKQKTENGNEIEGRRKDPQRGAKNDHKNNNGQKLISNSNNFHKGSETMKTLNLKSSQISKSQQPI